MVNSNTQHSRNLRKKTAAKFNKEKTVRHTVTINKEKEPDLINKLDQLKGSFNSMAINAIKKFLKTK